MATAPEAAPKPKSKKMLIIILVVVVLVVVLGAVGALLLLKKPADDQDGGAGATTSQPAAPRGPPTFLPLDNMVVNLADQGGSRFVQVGITLQLDDIATSDQIKAFMPTVRNGILIILSQRTTEELLQVQGKEQLAADITAEVSRQLGYGQGNRRNPIQAVLFSSFIIQ